MGLTEVPLQGVAHKAFGQMAARPVEQRGHGPAGDVHHRCGLLLLVPEGVDQDHGHALAFRQAGDRRRDVDRERRIGRQEGNHGLFGLAALLAPEVLEGSPGSDAAQPRLELRFVAELVLMLARVKDGVLGDVLGAGASAESPAEPREIREELVVVGIEPVSYPHEYVGSLHSHKRAPGASRVDRRPKIGRLGTREH